MDPKNMNVGQSAEDAKDPLVNAKRAFEAALARTKAETGEVPAPAEPAEPEEEAVEEVEEEPKPKAKKRQPKKTDEIEELKRKVDELTTRLSAPQEDVEPEPEEDPLAAAKELISQQFGDDEAKALLRTLDQAIKPLNDRTKQLERFLDAAVKQNAQVQSKNNKKRLQKTYPALKDDAAWEMIRMHAEYLSQRDPRKFQAPEEAYDYVARTLYGEEEEVEQEEEKSRVAASDLTPPTKSKPERKMTAMERSKAVFEHLKKNPEDVLGAKALGRRLRVE